MKFFIWIASLFVAQFSMASEFDLCSADQSVQLKLVYQTEKLGPSAVYIKSIKEDGSTSELIAEVESENLEAKENRYPYQILQKYTFYTEAQKGQLLESGTLVKKAMIGGRAPLPVFQLKLNNVVSNLSAENCTN